MIQKIKSWKFFIFILKKILKNFTSFNKIKLYKIFIWDIYLRDFHI